MTLRVRHLVLVLLLAGCALPRALAEDKKKNEVIEGITSSFSLPLKEWFAEEHPFRDAVGKELSFGLAFNQPLLPLNKTTGSGVGSEGDKGSNSRNVAFSIRDNPITSWFFAATVYGYFEPKLKQPWNPDFTYSFGYDDWRPYTFSLTYSNYGGNRFQPNRPHKEKITNLEQGGLNLGWKFKLPKKTESLFLLHKTSTLGFSVNHVMVPRYADLATNRTQSWKQSESLSCRYNVYGNFYWNVTAIGYPRAHQQQPWDPDFTYGFGYFDWHPGKISVEYNNYAGNRYPWKNQGAQAGKFRSGAVSIMWNVK